MRSAIIILFMLIISSVLLLADNLITRGPEIGEIYFIGSTYSGSGIYHSTDFGETATCMDSTLQTNIDFMSITADLTPGVLYGETMGEALYISYDYGQAGSWVYRNNDISYMINSGIIEGNIYSDIFKHSENYGFDFIQHTCNGFSGNVVSTEIDNQQNICYANIYFSGFSDSLFLYISYDNYENLELQQAFNTEDMQLSDLSRGTENGELYNFSGNSRTLYHSTDYGLSWQYMNEFNTRPEYYHISYSDMVGGRQPGEVYVFAVYNANMMTIKHTYIFHSTDYGRTFTVYHPLSVGEEHLVANFSASLREGEAPFTVQFSNYSIGDIQSYEWDFNNDGVIDSTEPQPEYTYQDTGYYSVKLSIYNANDSNEFLREDFIHVTSGNVADNDELPMTNYELSNYPNPFNPSTTISYELSQNIKNAKIEIYNLKGNKVDEIKVMNRHSSVNWNAEGFSSGIYFYKLNLLNSPIKKMILIK